VWDVATASTIRRLHGHDATVNDVKLAANEDMLVSASYDSTLSFWDLKGRSTRALQTVKVASDAVTSLALAARPYVFAASTDGTVTTIDIRKGCIVTDQLHHAVTSVAAPSGGEYVLAACTDDAVRLLDRATGKVLSRYGGHVHRGYQLECVLLCKDAVAAAGSEDGALCKRKLCIFRYNAVCFSNLDRIATGRLSSVVISSIQCTNKANVIT
jgi:mitogen-activated protein kinase organizer 1